MSVNFKRAEIVASEADIIVKSAMYLIPEPNNKFRIVVVDDAGNKRYLSGSGLDGKSAYEVAVQNGYIGTETEWLVSLEGQQGPAGDSAYQVAVNNGFSGTEAQWLQFLEGNTGPQGPTGATPTIQIGSVTGLPTNQNPTVTNTGTSSGAVFNFGIPKGETGLQGPQGIQGTQGATGPKGDKGDKGDTGNTGPTGSNAQSFNYKGNVTDYSSLPANASQNDAYYNQADQKWYIYNGTSFPASGQGVVLGSSDVKEEYFNNTLYSKKGSNISDITSDPVWPVVGMSIDSNGLTFQDKGVVLNFQTNLNKRFLELTLTLQSDSVFYVGTKNTEVQVGENTAFINCQTGKIKINDLFGSGSIEKDIPFPIVSGRMYIIRFYKIDDITKVELVDTLNSKTVSVQISQLGHFDKYRFGLDQASSVVVKTIGVYSIYKKRPFIGFYGDSNTEGNNVADSSKTPYYKDRFSNIIGTKLDREYFVSARSGGTVDGVLARMVNELPILKPKYVFVTIGTNGGNTEAKLNQMVSYCQGLGIKVILNLIPVTDSNSASRNAMIQNVVNQNNLLSVKTNLATSIDNDGTTQNTQLFINENNVYLHLNVAGNLAVYNRSLVDIPNVFDEAASEIASTNNGNSQDTKVTNILKYFLEQPSGVETLDSTYQLQQTNNLPIYGTSVTLNRLLISNNTLVSYTESGTTYMVFQNVALSQGTKKITKVVLDIIPLGNASGGNNASMVGIKSDGTIVPLIKLNTPPPTNTQHYEIDVTEYSKISLGFQISSGNPPANPNSLNQILKFYTTDANGDEDGVKKYIDSSVTESSGQLNVKNEGVKGDGITDDTVAINAAIVKLINLGGGKLYFPRGEYLVSQIVIPDVKFWYNIELVGEFIPAQRFGTITVPGTFEPDVTKPNGAIIKSTATGNGIIYCSSGTSYFNFNMGMLTVRNLTLRAYENPNICGIDAYNMFQLYVDNVVIDTGVYNVNSIEPTYDKSGIVTPKNSNCALTYLRNVCISGFTHGIKVYEHTNGDSLQIQSCKNAFSFYFASHASYFARCCFQRNTVQVNVAEEHLFEIAQLNMEYSGNGQANSTNSWQKTQYELNDPNNKGIGNITYANVRGAVGSVPYFRINGGSNVIVKRVGSETRLTGNGLPDPNPVT